MKKTAFHHIHQKLGAKMVAFGGYDMPVLYTGIIEEHRAVRSSVGVFDVSHMGEFEIRGPGAADFLQRMTINDVSILSDGKAQYSALCNENGGIIDDLLVYHCKDRHLIVVNASNIEKDLSWLRSHCPDDVEIRDISDSVSLLAVQGPASERTLQPLTDIDLSKIPFYQFARGVIAGHPAIISRTGYTGEAGFELYFENAHDTADDIWKTIFASGEQYSILPVGLGARDTLRLEMGYCLYGQDIDEGTSPLQAGLGWITKLTKGEFVGASALADEKAAGLKRRLVGLSVEGSSIPRQGYSIQKNGEDVGKVTSGSFSPSLDAPIALGYVPKELAVTGSAVDVVIRGRATPATVVSTPFYTKKD
jgi:aminomethyltransferase